MIASLSSLATIGVAEERGARLHPGNLMVSRTVYDDKPSNVRVGTPLPPNCAPANCVAATDDGTFPFVFNNVLADDYFGITSKIILDQLTPDGALVSSLEVPNSSQRGVPPSKDQMVASFSSRSELALNLSPDGERLTFMGYLAPVNAIDVSNSNTPGVIDPTNPDPNAYYRVVAELDKEGHFHFTKTNAFSGDNGRAAISYSRGDVTLLYAAGNAGNGSNPQPAGVVLGAGAQIMASARRALVSQQPGAPTPVASFNITQLPANTKPDKVGKDDNFRGLAIFHNTLFFTKGSGSNGIDTVYFVDTTGVDANGRPLQCPEGVGLPSRSAHLPNAPLAYDEATLVTNGLPSNMCILKGFNTTLAKTTTNVFPFGLWIADENTIYVADEGDGSTKYDASKDLYTNAAAQTTAGLQKWVFDQATGGFKLAYTLQAGLDLGVPYTVAGYPTGTNARNKNLPWSPATDGLRNLTGRVNRDGTVTIWAVTSTVSGAGDQGAAPNRLVRIVDDLAATTLPAGAKFTTVKTAGFAEVLRGVAFAPGTMTEHERHRKHF
ncbi:hypothetical protein [Methylosinus sp. Sm6]|uniref:hypothetical protein n=1 Tax=Methylosinus sp. Sm6 TaxID=2866948 RepID=UPI0021083F03|nr:hypothetical protein [Methylosinus sp. Sm6]